MSQTKAQLLNPLGDLDLTGQLTGVGATFTGNIRAVDGVFSGNVSVAGTLTKQDVTNVDSIGVVTARQGVVVPDGEGYKFGDGSYRIEGKDDGANARIGFVAGGNEKVRIDSSGNVGVNETNPAAYGAFVAKGTGNIVSLNASSGAASLSFFENGTGRFYIKTLNGSDGLAFVDADGSSERLRITSQGSVGINSTSPSGTLDVTTTAGTGSTVFIYAANHNASAASQAELRFGYAHSGSPEGIGYIKLKENGTNVFDGNLVFGVPNNNGSGGSVTNDVLFIKGSNQNVGINDSSPDTRLSVNSGATDVVAKFTSSDANAWIQFRDNSTTDTGVMVGANGDDLLLRAGSNERLRIGSAGQLGIAGANYGTAGQVIISGGSGSAVAWGDAAGGAEFAGIASGSISAGNPVIVHPDGKLSKVGYSWAADLYPNPSGNSNVVQPTSSAMQDYAVAMWARNSDGTFAAGTNPMVSFFYKNNSGQPQYRTSEVTNGTTNMVHKYSSGFNQGDGVGEFDIAWNPDVSNAASGGRMAAVFNRTSGGNSYPNVQILRGPYSNGVWTQGSNTVLDSTAAQGGISIAWHDTNRWVTVYGQSGSYYGHVVTLTGSTSASVGAKSSAIETGLATMSYRGHMSDKDNNGKHIVFYAAKTTGSRNSWRYSVATLSGTTVSFGTPNWIGNDANPGLSIGDFIPATSFDPDQNRFLVVYYKQTSTNGGSAVNKIYGRNAIISGTSVTWSAETEISNNNSSQGYDTAFDTNLKKHFVYIQDGTGANVIYNLVNFTGSAAPSTTSNAYVYSGSYEFKNLGIDYDSTYGMIVTGGRDGTDGNNLKEFITRTALSSSNLGDNNFVGFSKGSYTDGNTAKIGSLSALDENQTGLTTATTYYVKDDGTLSITPSTPIVAAGKAVSSTNLIVKDATPRPGSLGHWTYQLTGGVFKPWCACGYTSNSGGIIGAYECANSSCRYCTGCWQPYCCIQGQEYWNYDLPTEGGGNMCLGCGGCNCNSAYNICRNCCCCWPTGRFWFPETGIYCYNLNMILSACMGAPPSGGCWSSVAYYAVPKCRNRTCCNVFCGISGYQAYSASVCGYCEPRWSFDNVHIDGIVSVADTTKNFMAFGIHKASMTNCVIVQNGLQLKYDGCLGRYPNKVSFQKISNDPRITYCN